mmetsp:Transcript_20016/g.55367  ORF Transcript_20016/g.55367 Transcript_20016/m.55367 type:complete len:224 (-) Transcript_20016:359-1030(-)
MYDLHEVGVEDEMHAIRLRDSRAQCEVDVVELEVVGHTEMPPIAGVEPGEIVLLWPIATEVLRMALICYLGEHLLDHGRAWSKKHDASVDAARLAPRITVGTRTREEILAIHAVAMLVADLGPTDHCHGRLEIEEVIYVIPHEEVDIHKQDLRVFDEAQDTELRENVCEAHRLNVRIRQRRRLVHVLYQARDPACAPQELKSSRRHIVGVSHDEVVACAGPAQ